MERVSGDRMCEGTHEREREEKERERERKPAGERYGSWDSGRANGESGKRWLKGSKRQYPLLNFCCR